MTTLGRSGHVTFCTGVASVAVKVSEQLAGHYCTGKLRQVHQRASWNTQVPQAFYFGQSKKQLRQSKVLCKLP